MNNYVLRQIAMLSKWTFYGLLVQLIFTGILIAAEGHAQSVKSVREHFIRIELKNSSIIEAFNKIEQKTGYHFAYEKGEISNSIRLDKKYVGKIAVSEILLDISKETDLKFRQVNKSIIVSEKNDKSLKEQNLEIIIQGIPITGRVTSTEDNEGLPGVNVIVKGTSQGSVTDVEGNYNLDVPGEETILVFSSVGFTKEEITVGNQTVIDIALTPDVTALEEIIVVGYGTQKKSDITGTVASLGKDRLEMVPNLNVAQAIQGAIPGVMVFSNSAGAQPDHTILVRGRNSITANNDPLIILDAIPYYGSIDDINPNDVQSIEVLKDASAAAIYGSRGANGVILITTKEGVAGKSTFSYEGNYSITDVTQTTQMLTGPEFYDFKMMRNPQAMTESEIEVYNAGTWTNWTDLILRMGQRHEHNLTISGGFNDTKFYIGGGFLDIEGIAVNDRYRRYTSRINLETKLTGWLTVGTRNQLTFDDASGEEANFRYAQQTNPLSTAYDENGKLTIWPWPDNIIVGNQLQGLLYDDLNKSHQILTNIYAKIDFPFIEGLSYRLNTGFRSRVSDRAQYRGRDTQSGFENQGRASISNSLNNTTIVENILSYNKEFGNHTIFATALYSFEGYTGKTNSLTASKFPNDFLSWYAAGQAAIMSPRHTYNKTNLISQMLRLNYSYLSRYLLTLTVRRDGYSGFGSETKWGTFPSVALGWNLANENFFPSKDLFSELKLRASVGMNGNQAIGAYETLSQFTVANYSSGSATVIGYKPSRLGLDNLGWESSQTLNLGLDFGLFQDRVTGSFNWYLTNTSDLLLDRKISPIHGITPVTHLPGGWVYPAITQNIGETQNNGFEIFVNSKNIVKDNFKWSTTANFSYNKNEILSLYGMLDEEGIEIDDIGNKWFIGNPIRVNYDYVRDGVWQLDEADEAATYGSQPGYVKLKDINGDGAINSDDRQIIGQLDPKILWGLTNSFSYRNFLLRIFIHSVQGVTVLDYTMNDNVFDEVRYNTRKKNWWTPENPTNDWIMNDQDANQMGGVSGGYYENPDFIRIKDISLSYDLPNSTIEKIGLNRLRLYITGRNLFTITNWTGMDPDLIDKDSQRDIPMQKEYVFGLSLGF